MRPVTLNLASRPFRNNVLVGSLLTVIGVGLVAATGYNLYVFLGYGNAYARLQQEQTDDRARIVTLQIEERGLAEQVRGRDFRRAFERGKLASELVRKSAFSWTALFNTLEGVVPPDVVMTAIRPNISADGIVIRIEGVAKNSLAFLSLQDRLLTSPLFTRVYPSSERRLNPNLPDISFLLTCDYLPQAPPTADKVAAGTGADAAGAAAPAGGEGAESTAAAATPVAEAGAVPAAGAATTAGATQPSAGGGAAQGAPASAHGTLLAQSAMVVGRDGRPVDGGAEPLLAPGAIYTPPPAATAAAPAKKGGKRRPAPAGAGPRAEVPAPAAKPAAGAGTTAKSPAATLPASAKPAATAGSTAPAATVAPDAAGTAETAGPRPGAPARTSPDGRVWDPNLPRTMPAQRKAALASQPKAPERATAATRLDVPLSFAAAPAGDVYERLAEAHGVRFEFRPGVDRAAPVTLNLQGRRLEDALALVGGQTHQRVTRIADGVYQVEGPESGRALGVAPVAEEPIVEEAP